MKSQDIKMDNGGLKRLLDRAKEEGWIRDDIFRHSFENRAECFIENLPKLRNSFAHGSTFLTDQGQVLGFFYAIADVINNLFKR